MVVMAGPACLDSIMVTQPDGTKLWTHVHGDEFYNWFPLRMELSETKQPK